MSAEGFAMVPNWMLRDETISGPAVWVYLALASHSGKGLIFPSQATLAAEARISERRVRDALKELEELGVVQRKRRSSRSGRSSDAYDLHPNGPDQQPAGGAGSSQQPAGGAGATGRIAHSTPLIEEEPLKKNPLLVPQPQFEDFWALYPKHVARADAVKAWSKLEKSRADLGAVLEGARRYAGDPNLPEKQFIPYPATWLNGHRWDDDPLPARVRPQTTMQGALNAAAILAAKANEQGAIAS